MVLEIIELDRGGGGGCEGGGEVVEKLEVYVDEPILYCPADACLGVFLTGIGGSYALYDFERY